MYLIYLCVILLIIVILFYFRESKVVVEIVGNVVVEVEKELNNKEGQEKLEVATMRIKESLPKYLSIFISKAMVVNMIEYMLNILNKAFDINNTVDIKGNDVHIDLDLKNEYKSIELTKDIVQDSDFIVYGKVRGETDFRGKNNASIEIGFQKKL